jgi:hypothetical protein
VYTFNACAFLSNPAANLFEHHLAELLWHKIGLAPNASTSGPGSFFGWWRLRFVPRFQLFPEQLEEVFQTAVRGVLGVDVCTAVIFRWLAML